MGYLADVAFDSMGNMYILHYYLNAVYKVVYPVGTLSVFAGTGIEGLQRR